MALTMVGGGAPSQAAERARVVAVAPHTTFPVGVFDMAEPSGLAPPGPSALAGYHRDYVNDFSGPLDPSMWLLFAGVPKGDPAGRFEPSHVAVSRGLLRIGAWRDPARRHHWATGGVCLCGVHPKYGAFFVRSRETAPGPDDVELLWPQNNTWPPELDFDEMGTSATQSTWSDHYHSPADFIQGNVTVNVKRYHTWGVIWTPTQVTFVVDGRAWGVVTTPALIPKLPMTLDLQLQTWCGIHPECPRKPSSMQIDWVAVYTPSG